MQNKTKHGRSIVLDEENASRLDLKESSEDLFWERKGMVIHYSIIYIIIQCIGIVFLFLLLLSMYRDSVFVVVALVFLLVFLLVLILFLYPPTRGPNRWKVAALFTVEKSPSIIAMQSCSVNGISLGLAQL